MNDQPHDRHRLLSRFSRDIAMVLWPSFIAASIACLFFYAIFDPTQIGQDTVLADWFTDTHAGYALGFFSFWGFTTLSSALTLYLVRTEADHRHDSGKDHD